VAYSQSQFPLQYRLPWNHCSQLLEEPWSPLQLLLFRSSYHHFSWIAFQVRSLLPAPFDQLRLHGSQLISLMDQFCRLGVLFQHRIPPVSPSRRMDEFQRIAKTSASVLQVERRARERELRNWTWIWTTRLIVWATEPRTSHHSCCQ
jgi:hypothetical protein